MSTAIISWVRTIVPIGVASALSWLLVTFGLQLDKASEDGLVVGITGLLIALYYTIARALESKYPWLGVLLGVAQTPDSYSKGEAAPVVAQIATTVEVGVAAAPYVEAIPADPATPLYYEALNDHRP